MVATWRPPAACCLQTALGSLRPADTLGGGAKSPSAGRPAGRARTRERLYVRPYMASIFHHYARAGRAPRLAGGARGRHFGSHLGRAEWVSLEGAKLTCLDWMQERRLLGLLGKACKFPPNEWVGIAVGVRAGVVCGRSAGGVGTDVGR